MDTSFRSGVIKTLDRMLEMTVFEKSKMATDHGYVADRLWWEKQHGGEHDGLDPYLAQPQKKKPPAPRIT